MVAVYPDETKVELRLKNQAEHITLNWSIPGVSNHIHDVSFSDEILLALGFCPDKGWLYLLPEEEFWIKKLTRNNFIFEEILKKEQGDWVVVESKPEAAFGCKFIPVGCLRLYQHHFFNKYGVNFPQKILERLFL